MTVYKIVEVFFKKYNSQCIYNSKEKIFKIMKKIKYICFFDSQEVENERYYVVAATNKMQYIINVLHDAGITAHLISCSWSTRKIFGYVKGFSEDRDKYKITFFPSFGGRGVLAKILQNLCYKVSLLLYLISYTHKGEVIMAYHSLAYCRILNIAKRIKGFKLILEVEEIYQDVVRASSIKKQGEYSIFKKADAYVFSTELLKEKLNTFNKPDLVIYGTYNVEKKLSDKFDDGKIHVVYAGTFDPRKGGAAAAAAAAYLPNNYVVHICGFGNEKDTANLLAIVEDNNKHTEQALLSYEGLLKGETYLRFLQSCHIGLSTQNPNATFNATSFPSKILSYMSNGLSVVSVRIEAIERSEVGKGIAYYDVQSPEEIAKAVLTVSPTNKNRELIAQLDEQFRVALLNMLNMIS